MNPRRDYALALLLDLVGSAGALLIALRSWQTITTPRPSPLHDDVLYVSGRHIDSAPLALGLVALAGVVAVLATRGVWRRVVGGVLALTGVLLCWRAIGSAGAVDAARARALVAAEHAAVGAESGAPHVTTTPAWPVLTVLCGLLVLASGLWIAWRGHTWQSMSARYDGASADPERDAQRAAAGLWSALDRGDDPTSDSAGGPGSDPTGDPAGS